MFKMLFFVLFCILQALSASVASRPRPLVIWHGLGDSHSSPGMLQFMAMIKEIHRGIFIHSIFIEEDLDNDRRAGFHGNVNAQVELVSEQFAAIKELEDGFDAIGFSQGGQFLRAYVERYNSPHVNNLITFGSQHMGISDIPLCQPYDIVCQIAHRAVKGAVYSNWAQSNIVQAQYFRDPANYHKYLSANQFLTSINNEVEPRNQTYKQNFSSLNRLVLAIFSADKTVVPKESAWFGSEAVEEDIYNNPHEAKERQTWLGGQRTREKDIVPMRLQPLYVEDWIGLRTLDERGAVVLESCRGEHMQLEKCWEPLVRKYVGGVQEML